MANANFSTFWSNEVLDHLFGKGGRDYASPTLWIALSTTEPSNDGSNVTEPADGYARVSCVASTWTAGAADSLINSLTVSFGEASGDWGNISHFAIYDSITNGNMLAAGSIAVTKAIDIGDTPKFAPGLFKIKLV